jgi:hypothetical protein
MEIMPRGRVAQEKRDAKHKDGEGFSKSIQKDVWIESGTSSEIHRNRKYAQRVAIKSYPTNDLEAAT